MKIRIFSREDVPKAVALWNACVSNGQMLYAPMTDERFCQVFLESPHYRQEYMIAAFDQKGQRMAGFGAGLLKRSYLQGENFDNTPAYVTMVLVDPQRQRQGIGSRILKELEHRFQTAGKRKAAITYRNPAALTWNIPGRAGIQHNNAPGVFMDSPGYLFFESQGYRLIRVEEGMYLPLAGYELPEKIRKRQETLRKNGIETGLFDPEKHKGFEELFDALGGEVWRQTIRDNLKRGNPLPVLVASDRGKIVGFAGPIDREENGRGWFNGIGTHPDYEGQGIASVLFYCLMEKFASIGAKYSTLFTDEENPAMFLYRSAGFTTGARFGVMEKEV